MGPHKDIEKVRTETKSVYERQAAQFDHDRARDGREDIWLKRFIQTVPSGGRILDLGCGMGEPIAAWLLARGFDVTGVDYSQPMLEIARKRFPTATWVLNDMRELAVTGLYDGIISWHGSFHLTQDEQRALIPKLASLLKSSGSLMLTTGPADGEATGTVGGETVYHASLAADEYRELLETEGFTDIQHETKSAEGPFVLLARR